MHDQVGCSENQNTTESGEKNGKDCSANASPKMSDAAVLTLEEDFIEKKRSVDEA